MVCIMRLRFTATRGEGRRGIERRQPPLPPPPHCVWSSGVDVRSPEMTVVAALAVGAAIAAPVVEGAAPPPAAAAAKQRHPPSPYNPCSYNRSDRIV